MSNDANALFDAFDARRDEASFRRLYRHHAPMLFAFAMRLAGDRADAEELLQETWVRAVENHGRFDRRAKYGTWLTGILVNCSREARRRTVGAPTSLEEVSERSARDVDTRFPGVSADTLDVERALHQLPCGYREVVILHDVNGYTHKEIAAALGIRPGTSKSQLHRGRARLRELLGTNTTARGERGT